MKQLPTFLSYTSPDFPPVDSALAEPNGLLAIGGDLSPERLISAYRQGIFPWYSADQPILWWSPDPRCVLYPDQLKISRSLYKTLKSKKFTVTIDQAFTQVIEACSAPRTYEENTWISSAMKQAYRDLHQLGYAHSVETWLEGELVGGLYGLSMGKLFFGESMFSRCSDASKVAFVHLVKHLAAYDFPLIDCQLPNNHLLSLGACTIPRTEFLKYLDTYLHQPIQTNQNPWLQELDIQQLRELSSH